jgi:hypothetical protein
MSDIPSFIHPQVQSNLPEDTFSRPDTENYAQLISDLSIKIDTLIERHIHDGGGSTRINWNTDIIGLFETVSLVPTLVPTKPYDQIKFYSNGITYRMYIYDNTNKVWRYATLT